MFYQMICEAGIKTIKNFIDVAQKRAILKNMCQTCLVFELWRNRTKKKIEFNNISLWLENNIFKPKFKTMNDYKIKQIRNILNDFYKYKKKNMKNQKIRHAVIRYKTLKKGEKRNF